MLLLRVVQICCGALASEGWAPLISLYLVVVARPVLTNVKGLLPQQEAYLNMSRITASSPCMNIFLHLSLSS